VSSVTNLAIALITISSFPCSYFYTNWLRVTPLVSISKRAQPKLLFRASIDKVLVPKGSARDAVVMTTTTTPSHSFPTDRHNKGQSLKQKPDTTRPPIHQPGPDRAFLRRIRTAPPERRSTLHNPHVPRSSILIPPWPGPSTSPLFSHVHPPSAPDLVDGRACIDHGRESKRDVRLLSTATASVCLSRRRCVCVCVCVCVRNGHRVLLSRLPLGMYKMQENRRHPRHTVVVVVTDPLSIGIIPEIFI
jgi:hypothetical protein